MVKYGVKTVFYRHFYIARLDTLKIVLIAFKCFEKVLKWPKNRTGVGWQLVAIPLFIHYAQYHSSTGFAS